MSMEFDKFFDSTRTEGQTTNITLMAILTQLIGINRSLEDISKTLKEFIVEDDENE